MMHSQTGSFDEQEKLLGDALQIVRGQAFSMKRCLDK